MPRDFSRHPRMSVLEPFQTRLVPYGVVMSLALFTVSARLRLASTLDWLISRVFSQPSSGCSLRLLPIASLPPHPKLVDSCFRFSGKIIPVSIQPESAPANEFDS
jgi:hypothetical protein